MRNTFCKMPLWECNRTLIKVAQGQQPADLVIRHARLVSVTTHEVLEDTDVAIACGRVAYLGIAPHTAEHCIGEGTTVIDAAGSFVAPGFMDGHVHVESSMVGVDEYARAVVPHGTTGIYWDPHELCNVTGLEGVAEVIKVAESVPLKAMVTTPSCVPAVPGFEDTGAKVTVDGVRASMGWDAVVGLGEMMNYPGILSCQDDVVQEVNETLRSGRSVTGHYSVCETDRGLNAYVASGVSSCHESVRAEDVLAKLRLGMCAQIREGSAWQNLHDLAPAVADGSIDTRLCNLVSDDNHPNTLVTEGHLDRILRMAVREGIDPVTAIQMVTINVATYFQMGADMGSITPGKCADLVFIEDLKDFRVTRTVIDGEVVAEDGAALFEAGGHPYPAWMCDTMHVAADISEKAFVIPATDEDGHALKGDTALVRAMVVSPGSTITEQVRVEVPVKDGALTADPAQDLLKAFVFERHHATGSFAYGFVRGFGIHGALAQTVAHDAHNLLVVGDNDADMALAARTLVEAGGGEVAVQDGKVLGLVRLPICGLMSPERVERVAADVDAIEGAWADMGCTMPSPFMTMGLLSLACIPSLRLTNRGYVNTDSFRLEPVLVRDE
ncbi:adenine deaminase [Olsenella massiliensis]|uniref:adenine deaminase n=1 Tax=Olsenella massiliensis TaxID=1622075 RepID=UPI00071C597C|nr:adenine deaminase [Olsenella massiliensis]